MQQKIVNTVKHSAIYSITAVVSQFISIFLIPVYTRIFSPAAYGIMAGINMFTPIVSTLINAPTGATARFYLDSRDTNDRKLTASIGLYQLIFTALILILPLTLVFPQAISQLVLKDSQYTNYFIIALATVFFTNLFGYGQDMMRFNFQPIRYSIISMMYTLTTVGLSILLVVGLKMDITGALAASLIASGIFSIIVILMTRKYYSLSFSTTRLKEMLKYGLPLIPVGILTYALTYTDRYFLINYRGLADLGLYYVGLSLASAPAILFSGFQVAWAPILWSTYKGEDAKQFFSKILDYSFALAILAITAVSLFSREILIVITTTEYLDAYQVVPWLAFSLLFTTVFSLFVPGVSIAKKTFHHIWRVAVALIVNIGLNFWLVPTYGMVGAAIATLIASAVSYIIYFIMSQRYYPMHYNFLSYFKITSVAVVILLLWCYFFIDVSWHNVLIKLGLMLLLLISLFVFKTIGKTELSFVKQVTVTYFKKLMSSKVFHKFRD
jgi:O-antigen/teichoic acid export membrane protein